MEGSINILATVCVFLGFIIFILIAKTFMNKCKSLNETYVSNNKRLAFILSLINYEFKADFKSLYEIKIIKQNFILGHMNKNLQSKQILKVEKQESRNIRKRSKLARKEAATYLGIIGSDRCRKILEDAMAKEKDYSVKIYISNALTDIRNPESLKVMIPEIINTKKWYREKAISNILEFGHELQEHLISLKYSCQIEHIELCIKYANENFNEETKTYLFKFINDHEKIKGNIIAYYSRKDGNAKTDYLMNYLDADINQLLILACKTLSNYYYKEFNLPKYVTSCNPVIQTYAFYALSKENKRENFETLLSFIRSDEHEDAILSALMQMIEYNPRFLYILEDAFEAEESGIVKGRIAQILSNKIEYYILQLNTKHDARAEKIILEIIGNRKINELIEFINNNKNHDLENRLVHMFRDNLSREDGTGIELRMYLKQEFLEKWGAEPVYAKNEDRKSEKDKKLINGVFLVTLVTFLLFPCVFVLLHTDDILYSGIRDILMKYVIDFNYYLVYYSVAINFLYLALLILSYRNVKKQSKLWNLKNISMLFRQKMIPSVSIIAPAYNEEKTIVESTKSLLNLNYPEYELIIVNDGSSDGTLNTLIKTFNLIRVDYPYTSQLGTAPIMGIYRNPSLPKLVVVNKSNGGKADSLNAGLNVAKKTYFCGIDADSLLEPDALLKLASLTLDESVEIPALGGNIFPINGCTVDKGAITKINIPGNRLAGFQTIEYLRAFMAGRLGWEKLNCLLIISGAFGLFRKDRIVEIGGYLSQKGKYKKDTVGEDMELVVRISQRMHEMKHPFKIRYSFNANCWTEVPEDFSSLRSQRFRWHRGLIDILFFHRKMIFNPKYGKTGCIGLPYFLIFEMIGPMIELQGYLMVALAILFGIINIQIALLLFASVILLGIIVSLASLLIAEREKQYFSIRDLMKLIVYAIVENLGIRQMMSLWRFRGQISVMFGNTGWGQIKRKGQQMEQTVKSINEG
ncbi:glycosyltransferase [Parasporobacterium paucivorans]|uniref:Glycosyltransferase, catalytic subunit of cellulose synthase and poly-beta-1,6-N-acetylglucosamine synthase n=1 Tax=Parasporobacterium paucivorans DSM 15970 TaxID=1122934 RepID=A0A1M6JZ98_9FIRM|nr:glycosyltransferase [Parasporobacterium paucivorans]SHJ51912.1 Glycosyltransferase, catalytic subunit of cellulose synthase and poly-beta-1,6-N-acetylglucosamine synthase [Parasporobacterium paucivorans DSM 15970]